MYDSEERKSVQSTIFTGIDLQSTSAAQDPIGRMSSGSIGYAVAALGNRNDPTALTDRSKCTNV